MWFFFFKQKTAYEMRISDWSSDVCSSDLLPFAGTLNIRPVRTLYSRSATIFTFPAADGQLIQLRPSKLAAFSLSRFSLGIWNADLRSAGWGWKGKPPKSEIRFSFPVAKKRSFGLQHPPPPLGCVYGILVIGMLF